MTREEIGDEGAVCISVEFGGYGWVKALFCYLIDGGGREIPVPW